MKKLNLTHLSENVKLFVLSATNEERIYAAQKPIWIGYKKSKEILNKFDRLLNYPQRDRMPNDTLIGDSNNGKTAIITKFCNMHEAYVDEATGKLINPVLLIQAPPLCNEKKLYVEIMDKLFGPRKAREDLDDLRYRVIDLLRELEVKILIVDEIHNFLGGRGPTQKSAMSALRYLANELKIPIIGAGLDEALSVIRTDKQLANRFRTIELPKWTNDAEYVRLLKSFVKVLPLKKESMLLEPGIASKILTLSEGLIGEIAEILELSTILAIESGVEEITLDIINNIDYDPPTKREGIIRRKKK